MAKHAKTKSAAQKRFKKSAGGYKMRRANRSHILTKKTTKRKRRLRSNTLVKSMDERSVRRMLKDEG